MAVAVAALTARSAVAAPARDTVRVRLSEWGIAVSPASVAAGPVVFQVENGGTIPHAFEIEGRGIEKHGMEMEPGMEMEHAMSGSGAGATRSAAPKALEVIGGGPVIQILPGPFPFADSALGIIAHRPADQREDLTHKAQMGPYSNRIARISGEISLFALDRGATGDSVSGTARFTTQDGAEWRMLLDRVQTRDIPFNPRFGGVIMGLYYHGASNVHTPLVPTIQSSLALWGVAHLWRNGVPVADDAMVHIMLLSRTRRDGDFALQCWDCTRNPIEELQLQVTPAPGKPAFETPGGFLFVNWEKSSGEAVAARR